MKTLGQRIKFIRGDVSQEQFSKQLSISKGSLGFYERDENLPNTDVILKMSNITGTNLNWLLTGEENSTPNKEQNSAQALSFDNIEIPMVEAVLSAGGGSFETSDNIETYLPFKRSFIESKGKAKNMVVMRVSGDSMEPEVYDKDLVLIDQSKTDIRPSNIYAVSFEDCIYLKRVDMLPRQIALKSTNPAYPPVILDISDNMDHLFKIVGRVLWMSRDYS